MPRSSVRRCPRGIERPGSTASYLAYTARHSRPIELGAFRRQRYHRDVRRHDQPVRQVPTCLVHQQHRVRTGLDGGGDLRQMQAHCLGIAARQDECRTLPKCRADCTENVSRGSALILRRGWSRPALSPTPGDLVLLTNSGFVGEPDLYRFGLDALLARDFAQSGGEAFLKLSIASPAWA